MVRSCERERYAYLVADMGEYEFLVCAMLSRWHVAVINISTIIAVVVADIDVFDVIVVITIIIFIIIIIMIIVVIVRSFLL